MNLSARRKAQNPQAKAIAMKHRYLPLALLCLLLSACAGTLTPRDVVQWPEIRGQVLEDGTDKPIEGAMLVARWSGMGPYSHSECFHVEAATSDAQGNYVIPAWTNHDDSNRLTYQSVQLTVYAPGYIWVRSSGPFTNEETYNTYKNFTDWIEGEARTVKYMVLDGAGQEERFKYLMQVFVSTGCGGDGSEINSLVLLEELLGELEGLAQTPEEKQKIESIIYAMEKIKFGFEKAEKRHLERVSK